MVKRQILDIFFFYLAVLLFNQHFTIFCAEIFEQLLYEECQYIESILGKNVAEEFQKKYCKLQVEDRPELINEAYINPGNRQGLYLEAIEPLFKKKGIGNVLEATNPLFKKETQKNFNENEKYVISVYFLIDFIKFPVDTKKHCRFKFYKTEDLSRSYIHCYINLYKNKKNYIDFLKIPPNEPLFEPDLWFYLFQSNINVYHNIYSKNQLNNMITWLNKLLEKYDQETKSEFFVPRTKIENFSDFSYKKLFDFQKKKILSYAACDNLEPLFNFYAKYPYSKGICLLFQQGLHLCFDFVEEIIKREALQTDEIFQSIRRLHDYKKLNNNETVFLDSIPTEFTKNREFLFLFIINRWITHKTKVDDTLIIQHAIYTKNFYIIEKLIIAQKGIDFENRKQPAIETIQAILSQSFPLVINQLDNINVLYNLEYVQELDSFEIDPSDLNIYVLNRYQGSKHWEKIKLFLKKHVKNYKSPTTEEEQNNNPDNNNNNNDSSSGYTKKQKIFFLTTTIALVGMLTMYFTNTFDCQKKLANLIGMQNEI